MYGITSFTGDSSFWNKTHSLSTKKSELWEKLVPPSGESATEHGELLRMISRLAYDIFNNGLCNDKLEEIKYLQDSDNYLKYKPFLEFAQSPILLQNLRQIQEFSAEEDDLENFGIVADQVFCDRLDDIMQAIVQYCIQVETKKDDDIKIEWIKLFGGEMDAVQGFIGNSKRILIYDSEIQSSSALPQNIAEAKQLLDCYSRAIAMYEQGPS